MTFNENKQRYLDELNKNIENNLKDKSKKGFVDTNILQLINLINSKENYYTTSSCAGRIAIISIKKKKHESEWLFVSHDIVEENKNNNNFNYNEILNQINKNNIENNNEERETWLLCEPCIIHICCRTLEDAQLLYQLGKDIGFKHGGIQSTKNNKFLVELIGADKINVPLKTNKSTETITKNHLQFLIKESDKKLQKNQERINKLLESIKIKL